MHTTCVILIEGLVIVDTSDTLSDVIVVEDGWLIDPLGLVMLKETILDVLVLVGLGKPILLNDVVIVLDDVVSDDVINDDDMLVLVRLIVLDDVVSDDVINDNDMLVLVRLIVLDDVVSDDVITDDVITDDVITVLDVVIAGDDNIDDGIGTKGIKLLVLVAIVLLVMLGEVAVLVIVVAAAVVVVVLIVAVVEGTILKLVVVGTGTHRLLFLEYPSVQPSHASPL